MTSVKLSLLREQICSTIVIKYFFRVVVAYSGSTLPPSYKGVDSIVGGTHPFVKG